MNTMQVLFAGLLVGIIALTAQAGANNDWQQHAFYTRARDEARLIPIRPLGEREIAIDGKLDDWGDLRVDSFAIHQLLDHTLPDFHQCWNRKLEDSQIDAALIKLIRGDDALYVAIQVADRSVLSPADQDKRFNADVVDICIDLRPLFGDGPTLGEVKYTEGIYQLVFAPPCEGRPLQFLQPDNALYTDWESGQTAGRVGDIEMAGSASKDGYVLELRIPLASLPDTIAKDRLARPFGFEVMIADTDNSRPKGQPERMYYSCSGYSGGGYYYKSAHSLACTDPSLTASTLLSRLRHNALKTAPGGGECEGWVATALEGKELEHAYAAACGAIGDESHGMLAAYPFTTYPCPALGLNFHHRRVLSRLPAWAPAEVGNRYHAVHPMGKGKPKIDGGLDDWPAFDETAMSVYQYGHQPYCVGIDGRTDRAQHMLMTDGNTLYIAIRVKDDSVMNPVSWRHIQGGDCVYLYLDVRSPDAKRFAMSDAKYNGDVHRFCMVPPMDNMIHWKAHIATGDMALDEVTDVDYASVRTADGYVIELAIPLSAVQANPVPGRFKQPFGFELYYADIDQRGTDELAPMIYYSWGGSQEQYINKSPNQFALADYLPNRLPEVRQLVDRSAVDITVHPEHKLQAFSGFGGNYERDKFWIPDGSRKSSFCLDAANTLYIARNMKHEWARINLHLFDWEWVNDNDDPNSTDYADRFRSRWGDPDVPFDKQREGLHFKGEVDRYLHIIKKWQPEGTRLIAHADTFPGWLMDGARVKEGMDAELVECITSYMVYAKQQGIEFDLFAFKDAYKGYPSLGEEQYPKILKLLGESFKKSGLKTKLMLCDTQHSYILRNYVKLANDMELRQYLGGVGFEFSGSIDPQMPVYRLWSDLADHMGLPFIATTFGRPYCTSPTYLFEEVRTQQQLVRELKVSAALLSNFIANSRSLRDNLTFAQRVFPAPDHARDKPGWQYHSRYRHGVPILDLAPWTYDEDEVLTGLRYMFTRQFCELTPKGHVVGTTSSHPHVMVSGFSGHGNELTLHVSNAGPARKATISGIPAGIDALNVVRSGSGEGYQSTGTVSLTGGKTTIQLPAWSLVSLTSMKLE